MPQRVAVGSAARALSPRGAPRRRVGVRAVRRRHVAVLRPRRRSDVADGDRRPGAVLPLAQAMLTWRSRHADRILADMLNEDGGIGRWPPLPAGWGQLSRSCSSPRSSRWRRPACTRAGTLSPSAVSTGSPRCGASSRSAGSSARIAIAITRDLPAEAWMWAAITGIVHVPYIVALASAYDRGDFSLAYPVARGGGALLAGYRRHRAARRRAQRARCGRDRHRHRRDGAVVDRCRVGTGAHRARGGGDDRHLHHRRQPRRPRGRRQHVRVRGVRFVCA